MSYCFAGETFSAKFVVFRVDIIPKFIEKTAEASIQFSDFQRIVL